MAGGKLLRVDYDDLHVLDTKLTHIVTAMGKDDNTTSQLADAVGDSRLADKINDFGHSWAIHRSQIGEELAWMRDKVREIAKELKAVDTELAAGLEP